MVSSMVIGTLKDVAQPVLRDVETERERHKAVFRKMLRFNAFDFPVPLWNGIDFARTNPDYRHREMSWTASPSCRFCASGHSRDRYNTCAPTLVITKERSDLVLWNTIGNGHRADWTHILFLPLRHPNHGVRVHRHQYRPAHRMVLPSSGANRPAPGKPPSPTSIHRNGRVGNGRDRLYHFTDRKRLPLAVREQSLHSRPALWRADVA